MQNKECGTIQGGQQDLSSKVVAPSEAPEPICWLCCLGLLVTKYTVLPVQTLLLAPREYTEQDLQLKKTSKGSTEDFGPCSPGSEFTLMNENHLAVMLN